MDTVNSLFNNININKDSQITTNSTLETIILMQNCETLKWIKTTMINNTSFSKDLFSSFMKNLKLKFTNYLIIVQNNKATTDLINLYINHIDHTLSNETIHRIPPLFMVETALQIHKLIFTLMGLNYL